MLKNQENNNFDVSALQNKLQQQSLNSQKNNVDFNKKRKNHYKNEFKKSKNSDNEENKD